MTLAEALKPHIERAMPGALALIAEARGTMDRALREQAERVCTYVDSLPASPGYEPLLKCYEVDPILARAISYLNVKVAKRTARDLADEQCAINAIRSLQNPRAKQKTRKRAVETLDRVQRETSVLAKVARKRQIDLSELVAVARANARSARWDPSIHQLAAKVAPSLRGKPGPRPTAASIAHEQFLETLAGIGAPTTYTSNPITDKCTDERTNATRLEFGLEAFDPRPAWRRRRTSRSTT